MRVRRVKRNRIIIGLLGLVCLTYCSSNRRVQTISENPSPVVSRKVPSGLESGGEPDYLQRDRERAAATLRRDALLLFRRGEQLQARGDEELARFFFDESLDLLELCQDFFSDHPELEETYDKLLDKKRLEMTSLWEPDEFPSPFLEELAPSLSPLDEIGRLDLYAVEVDPSLENLVSEDLRHAHFDFPVIVNKQVLKFLDYYQGRGRKATEEALKRSGRYLEEFRRIFAEEGVPQDLVYMAHVESLFKPRAYSRARARGIWQFVAGTARLYDLKVGWWLDERLDVLKATRSAARHLKDLYDEFGDWYLALAGYNGGPGRVSRVLRRYGKMDYWKIAKRRLLPRETRNYVPSILAAMIIYKNPERYGFHVERTSPVDYETVKLEHQYDLGVIAESLGVPLATITGLNPELHRGVTADPDDGHALKIPPGTSARLLAALERVPPEKRLRLKHHRVRKGETLSHIAAMYGTSIMAIAEANHIRNINRLRLNQNLVVPLADWRSFSRKRARQEVSRTGRHTVRRGDSLYEISRLYGVKLEDLFRWNGLKPGDLIHPGQQIWVRDARERSSGSPTSGSARN